MNKLTFPYSKKDVYLSSAGDLTIEITENGLHNVKGYAYADVNVGGGGGSSDFSTAEVTVTNNIPNDSLVIYTPIAADYEEDDEHFAAYQIALEEGESGTFNVILYKEMSVGYLKSDTYINTPIVKCTGDISYEQGAFAITGAGTISVSAGIS